MDSLAGNCINLGALENRFGAIRLPERGSGRFGCFIGAGSLCDQPSRATKGQTAPQITDQVG